MVLPEPDTEAAAPEATPDVYTVPVPVLAIFSPPKSPATARVPALQKVTTLSQALQQLFCHGCNARLVIIVSTLYAASNNNAGFVMLCSKPAWYGSTDRLACNF